MLGKFIDRIRENRLKRQLLNNPIVKGGRAAIQAQWTTNHELIKDFSIETVESTARKMMDAVIEVATSSDPVLANREKLAIWVAEVAFTKCS